MNKSEVLARLKAEKVIALIRADSADSLLDCARALSAGGLNCIELTMTTPGAIELCARVAREQIHERMLDSPELIHDLLAPQIGHLPHESLRVILVNSRLRHTMTLEVSRGTVNETVAHPREILRPVITHAAHGFILVHNHPSGDPAPSQADRDLTARVRDAAHLLQVRFVDHVIIGRPAHGRDPWFSFRSAGAI